MNAQALGIPWHLKWKTGRVWSVVLLAGLVATGAAAAQASAPTVEVFTDVGHPVTRIEAVPAERLTVYRIDGLVRLQEVLSQDLPADREAAGRIAGARFEARRGALVPQVREAAQGLVLAAIGYRLDRYPAVVFDGRAVVYGVTDLAVALKLYRESAVGSR